MSSQPQRVLLIGMMGAGKSTTGKLLASRLGWTYLDSDEEVLKSTGRTVPEIWQAEGEGAFRAEETRVLTEALGGSAPAVVSVAGGAVLEPSNRARVRNAGLVVWLRASVDTLIARVGAGAGRPLLDDDPAASVARLIAERAPVYEELADAIIEVDELPPKEIVERIAGLLEARTPPSGGPPTNRA